MAHVDIQHVPYRGVQQVMPDVITDQVSMTFGSMSNTLSLAREGRVHGLAVTSLKREAAAPEFPTMDESGFSGFNSTAWFALLAPARTPAAVVSAIYRESAKVLNMPEVRKRFAELGMTPIGNSPAEFAADIKAEMPQWEKLIKSTGIRAE
jgi:tripartite-type tricarboxylate transporter receptor subunit TctC